MPENKPNADLTLLSDAARAAGDIAMRFFNQDPEVWDKGGSAGPVTEADLAVDKMLRAELLANRPGTGWLSEETEDNLSRLGQDDVFVVDPIDGTRAFIEGAKHWAHSLALVQQGQVTAAVVFMPATGALYGAAVGQGATKNGIPLSVSRPAADETNTILSNKFNMQLEFWAHGIPPVDRHFRSSLAYRLALVAEGRFDGMLTLRDTWEWDVAAGALLVQEAGGKVQTATRQAVRFNTPPACLPGLLAGSTDVLDRLMGYGPMLQAKT